MTDTISLTSAFVKKYGPNFAALNNDIRAIQQRRSDNLELQTFLDEAFSVTGDGSPVSVPQLDDLALANPGVRGRLAAHVAQQEQTFSDDVQTFKDEGARISQLLESLSDDDIGGIRLLFLTTLKGEGPDILKKLQPDDAEALKEVIFSISHLLYGITPYVIEHDLTPLAREKRTRLNPDELLAAITPVQK